MGDCDGVCSLELVRDDVIPVEVDETRIVFASLYTYVDNKDESGFLKIYLPPICLSIEDLYNIFYQTKLKRFTPFVMDKLMEGVSKLPLLNAVLTNYEETTGNDRITLTAQQKILLRQEINTVGINRRVQKIVNLDALDFIDSIADEVMQFDYVPGVEEDLEVTPPIVGRSASHKIRTSVEVHLFSESLQTGIILIVQFIAFVDEGNAPLDGPFFSEEPITYNSVSSTTATPACGLYVTLDEPPV